MSFHQERFKNLIHYICWRMSGDPSSLGAVKLNKALWLSDFLHYYQTGKPITGARYVRRQYGPVPSAILFAQHELVAEGKISVNTESYFGKSKTTFTVKNAPKAGSFSSQELSLVDSVIDFVCLANTAKSISDLSHDHVWKAAKDGEELPYYTIFAVPGEITDTEREWAKAEIEGFAA